jgi:hypothetical protein
MNNIPRRDLLFAGLASSGWMDSGLRPAEAVALAATDAQVARPTGGVGSFLRAADAGVLGNAHDEHEVFQHAIDQLAVAGGGVLLLDARTYAVSAPLILKPNVEIRGAGIFATEIKAAVDNTRVFTSHDGGQAGSGGLSNLTIRGFAEKNSTLGSDANKLVAIGPFEFAYFERVRAIYSRQMSLTAIATRAIAHECTVYRSLRDAINFSGCLHVWVTNNTIEECGDDAIAVHVVPNGTRDHSINISGNQISKSFGIKCLGARNAIIQNNTVRFWYGYAVNMQVDSYWRQGFNNKFNIVISNNTILDGLNATRVGAGNIGSAIFISSNGSLGVGERRLNVLVGKYDPQSRKIVSGDEFVNTLDSDAPRGPDTNLVIASNAVRQTIAAIDKFSDAGFGALWNNKGKIDPKINSLLFDVQGVTLRGDFANAVIQNNAFYGVASAIEISSENTLQNTLLGENIILRSANGIALSANANGTISNVLLERNLFDLDPFCESPLRSHPIDGSWRPKSSQSALWCGITISNASGARLVHNVFRNMLCSIRTEESTVGLEGNSYYYDWSATPVIKGIGEAPIDPQGSHYFVDCDPRSPRFGRPSQEPDSAFLLSSPSAPSSGWYVRGQVVRNVAPSADADQVVYGWLRLTTGNSHKPGDWAPMTIAAR